MDIKIALVGCGPYARASYLPLLNLFCIQPSLIIELENYDTNLIDENYKELFYLIPTLCRLGFSSHQKTLADIENKLISEKITHLILSSEPIAHFDYLVLCNKLGISCLCDKPIIAVPNIALNHDALDLLRNQHKILQKLYEDKNSPLLTFNLGRRFQPEYQNILMQVRNFSEKNNSIPDLLNIFYSGGNWYMPNEYITREGHPFKYGYGMMFHSGFHFVDFIATYLDTIMKATNDTIISWNVFCSVESPQAQMFRMGKMQSLLNNDPTILDEKIALGETSIFFTIKFFTRNKKSTQVRLEMNTCGLSGRLSPELPIDNFRGSGRLTQEIITISSSPELFIHFTDLHNHNNSKIETIIYHRKDSEIISEDELKQKDKKIEQSKAAFFNFLYKIKSESSLDNLKHSIELFEHLIEVAIDARINDGQAFKSIQKKN